MKHFFSIKRIISVIGISSAGLLAFYTPYQSGNLTATILKNDVDSVNQAVQKIDPFIQRTSMSAEQSAATAQELNSQAQEIKQMVETFMLSRNRSEKIKSESTLGHADCNTAILLGSPQLEFEGRRENMQ